MEKQDYADTVYQGFVRNLYMYNAGKGTKLGQLYGLIEEGVICFMYSFKKDASSISF